MHIVFAIPACVIKLTEKSVVKNYCTYGASNTEVQVRYKRSAKMETRTHDQKNNLFVYGEVYQDINESFLLLLEVTFLMYIFTHY